MIVRTAILSIPQHDDQAISAVQGLLQEVSANLYIVQVERVDSQRHWLEEVLRRLCDEEELDLILTIGGTMPASGPSADEIVPEATNSIIERQLSGFSEAMRRYASKETPLVYLDRGVAGIRGRTLIINLPAGAAPAYLFLEAVVDLLEPTILHLNNEPAAPHLADLLQIEEVEAAQEVHPPPESTERNATSSIHPERSAKKSLNQAEFARFLQKSNRPTQTE